MIKNNILIIMPESPFKLLWDSFILLLLIINIFYIPIEISFSDNYDFKLNLTE